MVKIAALVTMIVVAVAFLTTALPALAAPSFNRAAKCPADRS